MSLSVVVWFLFFCIPSNTLFQIAFLGLTSYERTSLLKQSKHMKQTLSLRRTPYKYVRPIPPAGPMEGAGLTVTTRGPAAILPTGFLMELNLFFLGSLSNSR